MLKKLVALLTAIAFAMAPVAQAQTVPGARLQAQTVPRAAPPLPQGLPPSVALSDFMQPGVPPRAVRQSTAAPDTPVVTWEEFNAQYRPRVDADGTPIDPPAEVAYRAIANAVKALCDEGDSILKELLIINTGYAGVDNEYARLQEIVAALPPDVKRVAAVMTVAQAAVTGAACIMTGLVYCIVVGIGALGNIFGISGNKRLQLVTIRIMIANLSHSRLNIQHSVLNVRMSMWWVKMVMPYCTAVYPGLFAASIPTQATAAP